MGLGVVVAWPGRGRKRQWGDEDEAERKKRELEARRCRYTILDTEQGYAK